MRFTALVLSSILSASQVSAELPTLSGANTSAAQLDHEYQLGRAWVRLVKSEAELIDDPVVEAYIKQLTWRLVPFSDLVDRRLEILVIDQQQINAFAAPGGIIGINAGLLALSGREDELASVIAHEIAHLSQRHFAQQQSSAEKRAPLVLAGMLGGILLSGINPNAGAAALHGTIGASASARLAFSRQNELDADQAGMNTLVAAGFDPQAMPRMFMLLQNVNQFSGGNLPEFLRTHPVTQSRIADSTNRAAQISNRAFEPADPDSYILAKVRAQIHFGLPKNAPETSKESKIFDFYRAVADRDSKRANQAWGALPEAIQFHPWAELGFAELSLALNKQNEAKNRIDELYALYPDDRAIQRATADIWMKTGALSASAQLYRDLIRDTPTDPQLWYQLAEIYGLLDDKPQLNRARIEFFLLKGNIDLALRQVEFARRDAGKDQSQLGWLNQREQEILALRNEMDRLLK